MEHTNEHEELKRRAPVLHRLPKADPFVVPNGFFDRFPHEVQARLVDQRPVSRAWSGWRRFAVALPLVALLSVGAWWTLRAPDTGNVVANLPAVNEAPLSDTEIDQLDESELVAALEEGDLPELGTMVDVRLNDDELLAYLDREQADLSELLTDTE